MAKLRTDHSKLFERWQLSLLNVADELSGTEGDFEIESKKLFEKEISPQLDELNTQLAKLAGGIGGAGLLTTGLVGMALLANPSLPLAAVFGLGAWMMSGRALPSVADYLASRKGPAFVWNKIAK